MHPVCFFINMYSHGIDAQLMNLVLEQDGFGMQIGNEKDPMTVAQEQEIELREDFQNQDRLLYKTIFVQKGAGVHFVKGPLPNTSFRVPRPEKGPHG
jgi:hypothetical protein